MKKTTGERMKLNVFGDKIEVSAKLESMAREYQQQENLTDEELQAFCDDLAKEEIKSILRAAGKLPKDLEMNFRA